MSCCVPQLRAKGQAMEEATGMKRTVTQRLEASAKSLHSASLELAALKGDRSKKVWALAIADLVQRRVSRELVRRCLPSLL